VGEISERLKRGKHTTRHVELFPYEGGYLIDTPGFSSLEVDRIGISEEDLIGGYPELLKIAGKCRFQDCRHRGELGCRVQESGISEGRLARYREFLDIIIETSKRYGK
jgi:ribosome biogenesis GTPase